MNFELIKHNFESGKWNTEMVRRAVDKGIINEDQYKDITGEKYDLNDNA